MSVEAEDRIHAPDVGSFRTMVLGGEGRIAVEFMSYGCGYRRTIEPILQQVAEMLAGQETMFRVTLHPTAGEAHMESSPIAVIFGVETWNFPYYQGAKVLMGGKRIERPGAFMQPTILANVEPAIALANNSDFGLGGSVFTRDLERGKRVASRIDTGMMFINNASWSDAASDQSRSLAWPKRLRTSLPPRSMRRASAASTASSETASTG